MRNLYFFIFILLVTLGNTVSAAVVINEIAWMGSDNGGTASANANDEWIELFNDGGTAVVLDGWLLETTDGKLTISLSKTISSQEYFLLERTDDGSAPNISADLIYTGALPNTGVILSLKDGSGMVVDSVDGSQEWKIGGGEIKGNNTTKETAQRNGGAWITASPTPRAANASVITTGDTTSQQETSATSTGSTNTTNTSNSSSFPVEPQIFASAGEKKRTVTVGGTTTFSGRAWGLKKEPIENARMLWNFGDGSIAEGKTVAHTYRYPGTYIVTLDASSGYYSASDRVTIEAVSADIVISSVGDPQSSFVELYNKSRYELDLSFWSIRAGNLTFVIPEHTFVVAGAKIKFASEVTGLPAAMGTAQVGITSNTLANVALYYPNGILAHSYSPTTSRTASPSPTNTPSDQVIRADTQPVVAKKTAEKQPLSGQENIKNTIISQNTIPEKETPIDNMQIASVGNISPETPSLFWWIMGVCAFAVIGIASAFFTKRELSPELAKNEADAYEIIEETEDDKIPF